MAEPTELDESLAKLGCLEFERKRFRWTAYDSAGAHILEMVLHEVKPQINGLMCKILMVLDGRASGYVGGLLKLGRERDKLLRELGSGREELQARMADNTPLQKPKGYPFTRANRMRSQAVTRPVPESVEKCIEQVLGQRMSAEHLVHDRSLRLIRQTFQQIQADISLDEVTQIWNEVQVERIHKS